MNRDAAALIEQVDDYVHLLDRVSEGGRFDDAGSAGPIRVLADAELQHAKSRMAAILRFAQAEDAKLAGEIARRSEGHDGGLATRMGAVNAVALVADLSGTTREAAGSLVRLGAAIRPRETPEGDPAPAVRPHLAQAVAAGRLPFEVATAIRRMMQTLVKTIPAEHLGAVEGAIVERALAGESADRFLDWLRTVPSQLDPAGVEEREADLVAQASVSRRTLANGLTRWTLDLDPLTDGFFTTALDANTALRRFRMHLADEPQPTPDEIAEQRKPLKRRRVDGVRLLAKKALKVDDGQVAGTAVTLLVTMTEEGLRTGLGAAAIPGCLGEISASTARMLAAEAEIIPVVLGGQSQPLDLGTGRRFFTEAQRRAMVARDGGCAGICGGAPPSWCDAAHIRPAGYGPTSIENGILLCWHCHQLLDQHGWQVTREHGRWWWTPPPHVDPTGRRRPGGPMPPLDLTA
ncbi:MAG: DUF222 domain-containing protein [Acidobacteria bacterium]|nr:DUF222 domain-containing protein [Acidobacteriota bacterium]